MRRIWVGDCSLCPPERDRRPFRSRLGVSIMPRRPHASRPIAPESSVMPSCHAQVTARYGLRPQFTQAFIAVDENAGFWVVPQFELGTAVSSLSLASMLSASISQSCANWMRPGRAVRSFVLAAFAWHAFARCRNRASFSLSLSMAGPRLAPQFEISRAMGFLVLAAMVSAIPAPQWKPCVRSTRLFQDNVWTLGDFMPLDAFGMAHVCPASAQPPQPSPLSDPSMMARDR